MSEPMFPNSPGGATVQEPVETPKSNRTTLLAVGGVLAALVVAGLAFMMLSSGGGDESADVAGGAVTPVVPVAPAAPSAAPTQAVVKPASVTVAKRNPFAPLYPAPASPAAPTSGSSSGGGADPAHPATTPEPVTPAVSLSVTTIDTGKQVATVGVDGKKYPKLSVGDSFGGFYTLYSIFNDQCVGVLYGDQSVPVCLNKPVSVTP